MNNLSPALVSHAGNKHAERPTQQHIIRHYIGF